MKLSPFKKAFFRIVDSKFYADKEKATFVGPGEPHS